MTTPTELIQLVTTSTAGDWLAIPEAFPGLNNREHDYRQVWRRDADLAIEWGMRATDDLYFDWTATFPDRRVDAVYLDILWRGQLIFRERVLVVDGGRAYLPQPEMAFGPEETTEGAGASTVLNEIVVFEAWARARLLDGLVRGHIDWDGKSNFATYWDRSGLLVEPAVH